jgi:rSAM/selenodomain-associated transferase 1
MSPGFAFPDARLMVFARAPVAGEVKTRLIPLLGAAGAARLHRQLLTRTMAHALRATLCPVQLWCAGDVSHAGFAPWREDPRVSLHSQQGNDLGMRMAHAFDEVLARHAAGVIIGTDCPELQIDDLRAALQALQAGNDAVLGPAEDGGYFLIGLRRPLPSLFSDMPWGTHEVLAATRARLRAAGHRWHELPTRRDVDRPADYARLVENQHQCRLGRTQ